MTTPLGLAERVTTLEYAVFEQIPATMAAMTHGATLHHAETVANGEAIAGLKVDMAALQASLHQEVDGLKAAIDRQGDRLRKELGVATASFGADVTRIRETMDMRFQKAEGQFNGLRADMDQRFEAVDQRFDGVDQRLDTLDAKLDTILSELRRPTG